MAEYYSYSKIRDFAFCPKLYKWRYVEGYRPLKKAKALALGSCMAAGVAAFRKNGNIEHSVIDEQNPENTKLTPIDAFLETWKSQGQSLEFSKDEDPLRSVERGLEILEAYMNEYPEEPELVVKPEIWFEEEIAPDIFFRGRVDGIMRDENDVFLIEDKTVSWLGPQWFRAQKDSYQILWYMFICKKLGLFELFREKERPRCLVNAIYINPTRFRFEREMTMKSNKIIDDSLNKMLEWIEMIRFATNNDVFPKADGDKCQAYGGCEYLPLKNAHGEMLQRLLMGGFTKEQEREVVI